MTTMEKSLHPLTGPRLKLGRAQTHLKELSHDVKRFFAASRHTFRIAEQLDGDYYALRAVAPTPPPATWGVLVGDIVHNLRSALDNLFYQLVIANGVDPAALSPKPAFPIFKLEGGKDGYLKKGKQLVHDRVAQQHADVIENLQPYKSTKFGHVSTLEALQELNNVDKHRLVLGVSAATAPSWSHFMFGGPSPPGLSYQDIRKLTILKPGFRFIDGEEIGRVHRTVAEASKTAEIKFVPIMDVIVGDGCALVKGAPVMPMLENMGMHVREILFSRFGPAFGPMPTEWSNPH